MTASRPSVFLLGAGYVGQHLVDTLLAEEYPVTVLVRRPEHASELEKAGAKTVAGTLSDLDVITTETAKHDITINATTSDDLPSAQAILSGIRKRVDAGQKVTFLHTSGTGELEDGANGMYLNPKIYSDDAPEELDALPDASIHRNVTVPIVQAAREFGTKAQIAVILPPMIYGFNPTHKRHNAIPKTFVSHALKRGYSGYVGEGHNVWNVVHVNDLPQAYLTILAYTKSAPEKVVQNPYFFVESGEMSFREVAENVSKILFNLGKIPSLEVRRLKEEEYDDIAGPLTSRFFGCNSRSRAVRLRELGWAPKEKGIFETWEEEIPVLVASMESS